MNSLSRRVFARSVFETFRKRARLGGFLGEARGSRLRLETRRLRAALGAFQTETCIRQRVGSVIVSSVRCVSSVSGSVRSVMSVSSSFVSREFAPRGVALAVARASASAARENASSDRARASARAVSRARGVALGARHPHLLRRGQKCVLRVQQLPLRLVRRADEVAAAASAPRVRRPGEKRFIDSRSSRRRASIGARSPFANVSAEGAASAGRASPRDARRLSRPPPHVSGSGASNVAGGSTALRLGLRHPSIVGARSRRHPRPTFIAPLDDSETPPPPWARLGVQSRGGRLEGPVVARGCGRATLTGRRRGARVVTGLDREALCLVSSSDVSALAASRSRFASHFSVDEKNHTSSDVEREDSARPSPDQTPPRSHTEGRAEDVPGGPRTVRDGRQEE